DRVHRGKDQERDRRSERGEGRRQRHDRSSRYELQRADDCRRHREAADDRMARDRRAEQQTARDAAYELGVGDVRESGERWHERDVPTVSIGQNTEDHRSHQEERRKTTATIADEGLSEAIRREDQQPRDRRDGGRRRESG